MASWNLLIDGQGAFPFGPARFEAAQLHFQHLATDTLSFRRPSRFDATRLCEYGVAATLIDPFGVRRFYGRRLLAPGHASGAGHQIEYIFGGFMDWLESITYHQTWAYKNPVSGQLETVTRLIPKAILNVGSTNEQLTIGAVITQVLQYAILRGAPIAIGTIDVDTVLRASEVVALSCADIIRNQLVYAPDAVLWADYSTAPYPTIHCRRRSALTAANLSMVDSKLFNPSTPGSYAIEIISPLVPIETEQVPCVALYYEVTSTLNGDAYVNVTPDIAPAGATGLEEKTFTDVIGLQGIQRTTISQDVEIAALPVDSSPVAEKLAFAARFWPGLSGDRVLEGTLSVVGITYDGSATPLYANYFVDSEPADWMDIEWEQQVVTVRLKYTYLDSEGQVMRIEEDDPRQVKLKVTSEPTTENEPEGVATYTTITSEEQGDPIPTGLAAALYASLNELQWAGSIQITEVQATNRLTMGNAVNLTGTSDARHGTMAAQVKGITVDIATGRTSVNIGPGGILSLDRRIELIKSNYLRRRWSSVTQQQTGEATGNGTVSLGRVGGGSQDTIHAPGAQSYLAVRSGSKNIVANAESPSHAVVDGANNSTTTPGREVHVAGTGTVDLNAADCPGEVAKLRLTNICVLVGSTPTTFPVKLLRTAIPGES